MKFRALGLSHHVIIRVFLHHSLLVKFLENVSNHENDQNQKNIQHHDLKTLVLFVLILEGPDLAGKYPNVYSDEQGSHKTAKYDNSVNNPSSRH